LALKNICDANTNDAENAGLMWIKETVEAVFMIKNYIMKERLRETRSLSVASPSE
jgi:hypothetical protein